MLFKKANKVLEDVNVEELDQESSAKRELSGIYKKIFFTFAILTTIAHIYYLALQPVTGYFLFALHVGTGYSLLLAYYPPFKKGRKDKVPVYDLFLIALMLFAAAQMIREMNTIVYRIGISPTTMDMIVSIIVILITLECTRRTCGNILPVIAIVFLLYGRYGHLLPGMLGHREYSWSKVLSYMIGMDAIFGTSMNASARMVFLFIVFGAFLAASGSGKFFIDLSLSVAGHARGGPAKVAVLSSALFGTVSGNSVANVVTTGSMTIPMMKSIGYKNHFAGAVEATASTGGQIMPPIMGSAAFIMASLIGMPYSRIVTAAIIPALLYFYTVFLMVDLEAIKHNLQGIERAKLPSLKKIMMTQGHLILPLIVLILVLTVLGWSTIRSALMGIITCIVVSWVHKNTRMGPKTILKACGDGALSATSVIAACGTAGIVVGVLNVTGTGLKFASAIVQLAGGRLWLALVLTMCASILLGMGLPTTASYLICAAVAAPALVQLGLTPLQAHMFVFYFACISAITPPVALAAYAGAGIAKAKPMQVAVTACKVGISAFVIPYMFCYGPALLWEGSGTVIITTLITAIAGATFLSFGMQRQAMHIRMNRLESIVMMFGSLLLIKPGLQTDAIGICICGGICAIAIVRHRKKQSNMAPMA